MLNPSPTIKEQKGDVSPPPTSPDPLPITRVKWKDEGMSAIVQLPYSNILDNLNAFELDHCFDNVTVGNNRLNLILHDSKYQYPRYLIEIPAGNYTNLRQLLFKLNEENHNHPLAPLFTLNEEGHVEIHAPDRWEIGIERFSTLDRLIGLDLYADTIKVEKKITLSQKPQLTLEPLYIIVRTAKNSELQEIIPVHFTCEYGKHEYQNKRDILQHRPARLQSEKEQKTSEEDPPPDLYEFEITLENFEGRRYRFQNANLKMHFNSTHLHF